MEIRPIPLCLDVEKALPLIPLNSTDSSVQSQPILVDDLELPEDNE
jgi:hypothetical protein